MIFYKNFCQFFSKNFISNIANRNIIRYQIISNFIGRHCLFFFLNHSLVKFSLKRYFKLIYKVIRMELLFKFLENNDGKIFIVSRSKRSPVFVLFFEIKEIKFLNKCKKYNIPILYL